MKKIALLGFLPFFLIACGDDSVSNSNETVSGNKVCIEGAHTIIDGKKYICENDEFLPEYDNVESKLSSSVKSSSSEELISKSSSSNADYSSSYNDNVAPGESCEYIGDWRQYGNDETIMCLDHIWQLQSDIIASYNSSSSSMPSSSSRNLSLSTGSMTDERDGKTYKTVTIGKQTWMAENLNYSDSISSPNLKQVSGCVQEAEEYCEKYGRLYAWTAAMDINYFTYTGKNATDAGVIKNPHQGICPTGWHIPNDEEWHALGSYLGEKDERNNRYPYIGKGLKYTGLWYHIDSYGDTTFAETGTNEFGFNALPAGSASAASYGRVGEGTSFWSATELYKEPNSKVLSYSYVSSWSLDYESDLHYYDHALKAYTWLSVRCVKN